MLILTIRTDKPESEIGLFKDDEKLVYEKWQAHRQLAETIHTKIKEVLGSQKLALQNIQGIVIYEGPGSFTGLRIGVSVANALGYGLQVPVMGATGQDWLQNGLKKLKAAQKGKYVVPEYGAPVFTTKPKK